MKSIPLPDRWIIFGLLLALNLSAAGYPLDRSELDDYIQAALAEFRVPGLALAVVKDDAVVLAKGYGIREREVKGMSLDQASLLDVDFSELRIVKCE